MKFPESRSLYVLVCMAALAVVACSLYLEFIMAYEPCPLCLSQRLVIAIIGVSALVAGAHNPSGRGRTCYAALLTLLSAGGAGLALRQLYLQSLPPDQVPACLPSLSYLMDVLPWQDLLGVMLSGTGDCAEDSGSLLGLGLPVWTLGCFLGFGSLGVIEWVRSQRSRSAPGRNAQP